MIILISKLTFLNLQSEGTSHGNKYNIELTIVHFGLHSLYLIYQVMINTGECLNIKCEKTGTLFLYRPWIDMDTDTDVSEFLKKVSFPRTVFAVKHQIHSSIII